MSKKEEKKLPFSLSATKNKLKKLKKLGWAGYVLFIAFFIALGGMIAYYQKGYQLDSINQLLPHNNQEETQEKITVDSISQPQMINSKPEQEQFSEIGRAVMSDSQKSAKKTKEKIEDEISEEKVNSVPQMSSESVSSQFNNLIMPLQGEIVSNCEWYKDQLLDAWKYNSGVNIRGEIGAEIKAVANGKVKRIIRDDYQGITIIITHTDKYNSLYSNLETATVKVGDEVAKSQMIAKLGDNGAGENSELHFEIIKGEKSVNPVDYFN
ncbi:M23 family metallopeptidase [Halanaerobacter jeridensis]|uniref:Murein DD-endopeptidase MepM/ murein hydrolase activator NlpD n=1 Tax=Halanaerobacter jeridensis TaxID=706427 RepID=A0A939BPL1_9FIRM|nr:M23 family metallopeptidase [Halanaerobacter jeridensis]MBM7557003.1 murein DD-endopeptidase MepM/ murein hydrolase activator NlpD [Halanaerobacter jeridensis]